MAIIGLSNLHYAKMTAEETTDTTPVYESATRLVGINSVTIDPENETATLYGDNQALATYTNTKERTVTFEIARLPLKDKAKLLGYTYDSSTSTMAVTGDASAHNVAVMFELDTDEDKKWLYCFYKGKFAPSQEDSNTRGESLEFGLHKIEGTFVARIDNNKVYEVKEIDATDTETTVNSWFSSLTSGN